MLTKQSFPNVSLYHYLLHHLHQASTISQRQRLSTSARSLTCNANEMPLCDVPRIRADKQLKEFRQEANLSWESFNTLWLDVCQFVYSPANHMLLDQSDKRHPINTELLKEITDEIMAAGFFKPEARATWVFGVYSPEPDLQEYSHSPLQSFRLLLTTPRFTKYVSRLIAYVAEQFIKQIPSGELSHHLHSAKVTLWLTNEKDTGPDNVSTLLCVKYWTGIAN